MLDLGRRQFMSLLGGAAAWPLASHAQQPDRVRRIGVLMGYAESDLEVQSHIATFREAFQKLGWSEGRNTQIDTRWAAPDDAESRLRFAKEIVALQPRRHSLQHYAHHDRAPATNAHHSHCFRDRCRPDRQRLRRELRAA
jgi:hypothetical protein